MTGSPSPSKGNAVRHSDDITENLHSELQTIQAVQDHWNRLSVADRAAVAKASPDLTLFFRVPRKKTHAAPASVDENASACPGALVQVGRSDRFVRRSD